MAEVLTFMLASMILLIIILIVLFIVWAFKAPTSSEKSKKVKTDLSKIKRQIDDDEE